jgi:hypothetical protein
VAVLKRLKELSNPPSNYVFWSFARSAGKCPAQTAKYSCNPPIQVESLRGCESGGGSRDQLVKFCGLPTKLPTGGSLRVDQTKENNSGYWQSRACSDAPLPDCAVPHREKMGTSIISPGLQCSFKETKTASENLLGPLAKYRCSSDSIDLLERSFRARTGVPEGVVVELARVTAPDLITEERPDLSCVLAREVVVREEVQCGVSVGIAGVEQCCEASAGDCRFQPSRLASQTLIPSFEGSKFTPAINRVVGLVQAAFPRAQYRQTCSEDEPYCFQVQADAIDGDRRARISASINVPYNILRLAGPKLVKVSFEAARTLERSRLQQSD